MWGSRETPEDCTAVVRVMQDFEKLAAAHGHGLQETNFMPKARLEFDEYASPTLVGTDFNSAEKVTSRTQSNKSRDFSIGSLARKSDKEREKDIELLCAKGRISQLQSESNSLRTERKRARIEQEQEIDVRQGELLRQIEKNSELRQQLKYVFGEEKNVKEELEGTRKKFQDYKKRTEEKINSLQREKLKTSSQVIEIFPEPLDALTSQEPGNKNTNVSSKEALRKQLFEMKEKLFSLEAENILFKSKMEENGSQLEYFKRLYTEARRRVEETEDFRLKCLTAEHKVKELNHKLSRRDEATEVAMTMQSQLSKYYEIECENSKLKEQNSYLQATNKNNLLLNEKLLGCQNELKRAEEKLKSLYQLEIECEKQRNIIKKWDVAGDGSIRSPEEMLQEIAKLQQSQVLLSHKHSQASASARISSDALKQQSEELVELKVKLSVVEEKFNEQSEKLKQMMKKLSLVTTDRDGLRRLLNSYDTGDSSPQLSSRVQHTEEQLKERNLHIEKLEKDLKLAIERGTEESKKYNKLKIEYDQVKKTVAKKQYERKDLDEKTDRGVVEILKEKNQELLEKVNILETRIEQRNLQGDFDPSKVKVVHLALNPFMQARQSKSEEMEKLKEECEVLRRKVKVLEEGDKSKRTHIEHIVLDEPSPQNLKDLEAQVSSAERKNQRLKEVFSKKIQEFREACYILTGYRIDVVQDQQYRLKSMYAERSSDNLLFQCNAKGKTMLLETDYSMQVKHLIDNYLTQCDSIPAFLSGVTLELFERQTQMIN